MADLDDIREAIKQVAAEGLDTVTLGGQTVNTKSLIELIEADKYLRGIDSVETGGLGCRFRRIKPNYR